MGGLMVSESVRVNPRHTCPECGSDDVELVRADGRTRDPAAGSTYWYAISAATAR